MQAGPTQSYNHSLPHKRKLDDFDAWPQTGGVSAGSQLLSSNTGHDDTWVTDPFGMVAFPNDNAGHSANPQPSTAWDQGGHGLMPSTSGDLTLQPSAKLNNPSQGFARWIFAASCEILPCPQARALVLLPNPDALAMQDDWLFHDFSPTSISQILGTTIVVVGSMKTSDQIHLLTQELELLHFCV